MLRKSSLHRIAEGRGVRAGRCRLALSVFVAALAGVLVGGTSLSADTLVFQNGERLGGKVLSEQPEKIVFESGALGRIEISRERILRIEREAPPTEPTFVPPAPDLPVRAQTPATSTATNPPAPRRFFGLLPPPSDEKGTDWIQLKSGEWLRGRLHGMQNRKVEFESDELDDLTFDWKDIHQVRLPRALVSYGDRLGAFGALRVDRQTATVSGMEEVRIPREDVLGITPGEPRELDYWSGKFNVGLNLRAGNTEQADVVAKAKIERRTPLSHLKLEYAGNFSELEGVESVNNHQASLDFDIFLTRRMFIRTPLAAYYRDPFQNIARRTTLGAGLGYYLIDTPKTEWLILGGPAYQHTLFDTVAPGQASASSTPALVLGSRFEVELSKNIDFEVSYQALIVSELAGRLIQHAEAGFEIDLTRRLDVDISFTWDSTRNPQADAAGLVPEQNDLRLSLSLGVKF